MKEQILDYTLGTLLVLGILAIVGGIGLVIFKSIAADGVTDYCYIEFRSPDNMPNVTQLWAHRNWRSDRLIGAYKDQSEALEMAKKLECHVGGKK